MSYGNEYQTYVNQVQPPTQTYAHPQQPMIYYQYQPINYDQQQLQQQSQQHCITPQSLQQQSQSIYQPQQTFQSQQAIYASPTVTTLLGQAPASLSTPLSNKDYTLVTSKRKKESPEVKPRSKQSKVSTWLSKTQTTSTNNRFELLDKDSNEETTPALKPARPPPIFIAGVQDVNPLMTELKTLFTDGFTMKILNNDEVKIQTNDPDKYRATVQLLMTKKQQFHTYKPRLERNFRVVLRGIHPSTGIEEIKKEIEDMNHVVINIHNIKQRITGKPLPLFYVDLQPKQNNKDIYNITSLLHTIIKFESPKPKMEIPQCTTCQRYEHTKKFCHRHPRCVKCAGDHLTKNCERKVKDANVRCVLCSGNHPANYKGCSYYQTIHKKKYPEQRKRDFAHNTAETRNLQNSKQLQSNNTIPQNSINRNKQHATQQPGYVFQHSDFPQLPQPRQHYLQQFQPVIQQQSNDMSELKQMMKSLMTQMGTMLNLLTSLVSKMG